MNYKKLGKMLGKIMILESILMLAPLAVAMIYKEGMRNILAFTKVRVRSAVKLSRNTYQNFSMIA